MLNLYHKLNIWWLWWSSTCYRKGASELREKLILQKSVERVLTEDFKLGCQSDKNCSKNPVSLHCSAPTTHEFLILQRLWCFRTTDSFWRLSHDLPNYSLCSFHATYHGIQCEFIQFHFIYFNLTLASSVFNSPTNETQTFRLKSKHMTRDKI